jgi:hypothetical protein
MVQQTAHVMASKREEEESGDPTISFKGMPPMTFRPHTMLQILKVLPSSNSATWGQAFNTWTLGNIHLTYSKEAENSHRNKSSLFAQFFELNQFSDPESADFTKG